MQEWKTWEWKTRHQTAGVENVGLENAAPDCRGGKRGTGKCRSLKSIQATSHSYGTRQNSTLRNFVLPGPIITKLGMFDYVGDPYSEVNFS